MDSIQGRREMQDAIKNLAQRVDVLLLQEVHGRTSEILTQLSLWLPGFVIYGTGCEDVFGTARIASGGCAIVIRPHFALTVPQHLVMVPGRCHFVSFTALGDAEVHICNSAEDLQILQFLGKNNCAIFK